MLNCRGCAVPGNEACGTGFGATRDVVFGQEPGDIEIVFARETVEEVTQGGGGVGLGGGPGFRERLGQLDDRPVVGRRVERVASNDLVECVVVPVAELAPQLENRRVRADQK